MWWPRTAPSPCRARLPSPPQTPPPETRSSSATWSTKGRRTRAAVTAFEDAAAAPVEDAVVDEAADGPVDAGGMTEGWVGPEASDTEIADPETTGFGDDDALAGTAPSGV